MHTVNGWSFLKHYGTEKLLISLEGKLYQAGDNLEENIKQLKHMCEIKIEKFRVNSSRHKILKFLPFDLERS